MTLKPGQATGLERRHGILHGRHRRGEQTRACHQLDIFIGLDGHR